MNKDQIKGKVEEAKGKVKEVAGKILDDKGMEIEGNVQKNVGKVQSALAISRKILRKKLKTTKTRIVEPCSQVRIDWSTARRQRDTL